MMYELSFEVSPSSPTLLLNIPIFPTRRTEEGATFPSLMMRLKVNDPIFSKEIMVFVNKTSFGITLQWVQR